MMPFPSVVRGQSTGRVLCFLLEDVKVRYVCVSLADVYELQRMRKEEGLPDIPERVITACNEMFLTNAIVGVEFWPL